MVSNIFTFGSLLGVDLVFVKGTNHHVLGTSGGVTVVVELNVTADMGGQCCTLLFEKCLCSRR